MEFGCSFGIFLNSAHLICQSTDISKCFSWSLRLRDTESRLYTYVLTLIRTVSKLSITTLFSTLKIMKTDSVCTVHLHSTSRPHISFLSCLSSYGDLKNHLVIKSISCKSVTRLKEKESKFYKLITKSN